MKDGYLKKVVNHTKLQNGNESERMSVIMNIKQK